MKKLLLLVDGSGYLYRAYHALPDLRNAQGEPTGAIYGFLNMLLKLEKDYPTAFCACVFDARGKTFRHDLFPEYKANRPHMPEDLAQQVDPICKFVQLLGWPLLSISGVEADDVIGSLTKQAQEKGFDVVISTGDKDLAQLVTPQVKLVNTMKNEVLDEQGVQNKFGVPPNRMIDYLTLIGDTSDNIPGVKKVGPKTAVKWLTTYGDLDAIIQNASQIKGAVGDNLQEALNHLPLSKTLITIKTDGQFSEPLPEIETLVKKESDFENLYLSYKHYGFKQLATDAKNTLNALNKPVDAVTENAPTTSNNAINTEFAYSFVPKKEYSTITTIKALDQLISQINQAKLVALDTETTSLNFMQARLVGISIATEPGIAAYIPLAHESLSTINQLPIDVVLNKLKPWLENPNQKKVGQNIKYDCHVFANHDIQLAGIEHDTLLQSYVLASHERHDMDSLSQKYLNHETITYESLCGKGVHQISFAQVSIDKATEYAAEDADITLQLHLMMYPQIEADKQLHFIYKEIEMPTLSVLQKMERTGVLVDDKELYAQSGTLSQQMALLEQSAYSLANTTFNLNSPKQLADILFNQQKLPIVKKTPTGTPSTNEEVLEKLANDGFELPLTILNYRTAAKLKSTYTDKLPRMINTQTYRIHANFSQAVAVTGRLASSDPNLQNIPVKTDAGRKIRETFIAPPDCFIISADYSQIELRIMAHLSQDKMLLQAFAQGEDVHKATACELFEVSPIEVTSEQRRYAKVINFGLIYGMSAFGVASNLGISRQDATRYMERYFERYSGVKDYMDNIRQQAKADGFVRTVFGRKLWVKDINSSNALRRQGAERSAINGPMQGTAADIIKLAMIALNNYLVENQLKSKLILQVHDELILEVPKEEREIITTQLPAIMSRVAQLDVPLVAEVGVGTNWEAAH